MANTETMETNDIGTEAGVAIGKKYRVQLDFSAEDFQELNDLTAKLGLTTRAELFRCSLMSLRWIYKKKLQGYTVAAVSPGRKFLAEPEFPFLDRIVPERLDVATTAEAKLAAAFEEVAATA